MLALKIGSANWTCKFASSVAMKRREVNFIEMGLLDYSPSSGSDDPKLIVTQMGDEAPQRTEVDQFPPFCLLTRGACPWNANAASLRCGLRHGTRSGVYDNCHAISERGAISVVRGYDFVGRYKELGRGAPTPLKY